MVWRVASCLITLRNQINSNAPNRSKASDGTIGDAQHAKKTSDHNPWVLDGNTGVVTAMDITNDPANGCDAQDLVDVLVKNQDSRIKYIIWNKQIVSSSNTPWVWRKYTGTNPHNKHFHISVKPDKNSYDSTQVWNLN